MRPTSLILHGVKWGLKAGAIIILAGFFLIILAALLTDLVPLVITICLELLVFFFPAMLLGGLAGGAIAGWVLLLSLLWPEPCRSELRQGLAILPGASLFAYTCFNYSSLAQFGGWLWLVLFVYSLLITGLGEYLVWWYKSG